MIQNQSNSRMFTKGLWKSKNQHSLEYLKYLYSVLCKNQTVTEKNSTLLVEVMRLISEVVIWGDQNDSTVTDFFLEKNILSFFLRYLRQKSGGLICVQLLQTLNILFENIRNKTSMYYLLSNNHINSIICHKFDFSDEEVMAYYILFLKTLSLKLDRDIINFFYNQYTDDFMLYTEAIKFFDHPESMVRIAVRTITLNVFKVEDKAMLHYIYTKTAVPYFDNLVWSIGNQLLDIDSCVRSGEHISRLEDLVQSHIDNLLYVNDILSLDLSCLNQVLSTTLLDSLMLPLFVYSLVHKDASLMKSGNEYKPQKPHLSRPVALFLLTQVFLVHTHPSLVRQLARFIFTADLSALQAPKTADVAGSPSKGGEEYSSDTSPRRRPLRFAFLPPEESLAATLDRVVGVPRPGESLDDNESLSLGDANDRLKVDPDTNSDTASLDGVEMVTSCLKEGERWRQATFEEVEDTTNPQGHNDNLSPDSLHSNKASIATSLSNDSLEDAHPTIQNSSMYQKPQSISSPNKTLGSDSSTTNGKQRFSVEGRPFLAQIFESLDTEGDNGDDYEAILAVTLLYAIVTNKGIDRETLQTAQLSAPNENTGEYNCLLVKKLIKIINNACKLNSRIRLVTLEMTSLLLRVLVDSPDRCFLEDDHMAYIEGAKEDSTRLLRNYFTNDDNFLEIFESESLAPQSTPLTRVGEGRLVLDSAYLVPPPAPSSALPPHRGSSRLGLGSAQSQDSEKTRRAIRVWFQLYRLSRRVGLGREPEECGTESKDNTPLAALELSAAVQTGDKLNLSNRELIACKIDKKDSSKCEQRFLVMDPQQIILVEPDVKQIGWGVATFVGFLQHVTVSADKDDSHSLHIVVQCPSRPPPSPSHRSPARTPLPLLKANFQFDDNIRCMAAKHRLNKGSQTARQTRLQQIARLLEIPVQATANPYTPPIQVNTGFGSRSLAGTSTALRSSAEGATSQRRAGSLTASVPLSTPSAPGLPPVSTLQANTSSSIAQDSITRLNCDTKTAVSRPDQIVNKEPVGNSTEFAPINSEHTNTTTEHTNTPKESSINRTENPSTVTDEASSGFETVSASVSLSETPSGHSASLTSPSSGYITGASSLGHSLPCATPDEPGISKIPTRLSGEDEERVGSDSNLSRSQTKENADSDHLLQFSLSCPEGSVQEASSPELTDAKTGSENACVDPATAESESDVFPMSNLTLEQQTSNVNHNSTESLVEEAL